VQEAETVRKIARQYGMEFILGREDVQAIAERGRQSIEEAAREARYAFLFGTAREARADCVAVAHTADDQGETVLMHLLRGAGLSGLRGMAWKSLPNEWSEDIPLVRPLLKTWRSEVEAYCDAQGIQPLEDESNQDTTFFRNRLRHELIPMLETYNPQVRELLWRTADTVRSDYEMIHAATLSAYGRCLVEMEPGQHAIFWMDEMVRLPEGVARNLVRYALYELVPGIRDVGYEVVLRAVESLRHPAQGRRVDMVGGAVWVVEGDQVVISCGGRMPEREEWPGVAGTFRVEVGSSLSLGNGWRLNCQRVECAPDDFHKEQGMEWQVWLDEEKLTFPLILRPAKPGERFAPLGMEGKTMKVFDFYINVKMPRRARRNWPVLVSGKEIAWVPGHRPGEPFRLSEGSGQVIHLELHRR
jgi:tRNA(Ile)-lysidine synthase